MNRFFSKKTALLFPGQGSQKIGMGKDLFAQHRVVRDIFDQMDSVLKMKLSQIMMEGDNEVLSRSEYSQPAILAVSYAMFKVYQEKTGFKFEECNKDNQVITIGHSLGEFSALTVSNMFEFEDAIEIVHQRGKAMHECLREGTETSMVALVGDVSTDHLQNVIKINNLDENQDVVEIANINSPQQIVLSGYKHSVHRLIELLKQDKLKFKAIPLNVQLPFHCKLLSPVCDVLKGILDDKQEGWKLLNPTVPILMNLDAKLYDDSIIINQNLVHQTIRPVDFRGCIQQCQQLGITDFIEVGFGNTLSALVSRNIPNAEIKHIIQLL